MGRLAGLLGRDMAVDLGTASTHVYVSGRGVVLAEPSVVAIDAASRSVLAVGSEAKKMQGRTPDGISVLHPMRDGVIADFDATEDMLRIFLDRVATRGFLARPRIVFSVPSSVTGVERRAVEEAGYAAGARRVYIVSEAMAAAIGARLPIYEAAGSMVVDIGAGTTEVAVISLGGVVSGESIPIGGNHMDRAVIDYVKKEYSLVIGEPTAEDIKVAMGSAFPQPDEPNAEIRGRDMVSGLPRTVIVSAREIRAALDEPVLAIMDAIRSALDRTPPELAGDIMDRGIVLTGGASMLKGLDERLRHEMRMPVEVADDPVGVVARGAGRCVEDFDALKPLLLAGALG